MRSPLPPLFFAKSDKGLLVNTSYLTVERAAEGNPAFSQSVGLGVANHDLRHERPSATMDRFSFDFGNIGHIAEPGLKSQRIKAVLRIIDGLSTAAEPIEQDRRLSYVDIRPISEKLFSLPLHATLQWPDKPEVDDETLGKAAWDSMKSAASQLGMSGAEDIEVRVDRHGEGLGLVVGREPRPHGLSTDASYRYDPEAGRTRFEVRQWGIKSHEEQLVCLMGLVGFAQATRLATY